MVRMEYTKGYEGYQNSVEKLSKDNTMPLYIYFMGNKDEKGVNWCPDCNDAQPFLKDIEKFATDKSTLLVVEVGDGPFWHNMKNPFRTDPNIKLTVIPTLIRWKSGLRLEEGQCTKLDLLKKFFNEK